LGLASSRITTHYHALPRITTHYHHPLPLGQRHLEKPDQKLKTPKASLAVPSEQKELQKQKQKLALEIKTSQKQMMAWAQQKQQQEKEQQKQQLKALAQENNQLRQQLVAPEQLPKKRPSSEVLQMQLQQQQQ
jgi:hypothetical protein